MDVSSDEEGCILFTVPRRLIAFRSALQRAITSPTQEEDDCSSVVESVLMDIVKGVLTETSGGSDGWTEVLAVFHELQHKAREQREFERAFENTVDGILDKSELNYSSLSTTIPDTTPLSDIVSFLSSNSKFCDGVVGQLDSIEIATTLKSLEHKSLAFLNCQLACATEAARTQLFLSDLAAKWSQRELVVEVVDHARRIIATKLLPALEAMAYANAITCKGWSQRVEVLSTVFSHIMTTEESQWERLVREIRSELNFLLKDSMCESCLMIPASFNTRCCQANMCQRCLNTMMTHPARGKLSSVQCPCCGTLNKLTQVVTVVPLSAKLSSHLLQRLITTS